MSYHKLLPQVLWHRYRGRVNLYLVVEFDTYEELVCFSIILASEVTLGFLFDLFIFEDSATFS